MKDNNMSSNPDIKTYLTRDIFTYISFAINEEKNTDTAQFKTIEIGEGDTGYYRNGYYILNKVEKNPSDCKFAYNPKSIALMADITFYSKDSMRYKATPLIEADSFGINNYDDTLFAQNLFVKFAGVSDNHKIKLGIKESDSLIDFVTVKAYVFPYIILVWIGLIIMAFGILLSVIKRAKINNNLASIILTFITAGLIYMFIFAN
jgi:cytochrome c-type biogenesis protein CcmF